VPLDFFPDAVRPFLHAQRLPGSSISVPDLLRRSRGAAALQSMALQAGWALALIGLGRFAMTRMMHRLEMQGG